MMAEATIEPAQVAAFAGKVFGDAAGTMATAMASIGDRLGLFRALAAAGPASSVELAQRTDTNERYVREWLAAMASAGYLSYATGDGRFALPPAHAAVLADEGGPAFLGGAPQEIMGLLATLGTVTRAFRSGGGVAIADFDPNTWAGLARITGTWFTNALVQHWLPLVPDVQARLTHGARVADIGCGDGQASSTLARAFPNSRFVGYDLHEPAIVRARANARQAGVSDRVQFERLDASVGVPGPFDLITTFDVVHDAADPRGMLRAIRRALTPDGIYLCVEPNASGLLEENIGPQGAFFYGLSVLFCLTQSLAAHGEGLGTFGLHEAKLRELCVEAQFGTLRTVPIDDPFSRLYEIRASVGGI